MNLNQITVPVLDVEKSIAFYQKLGLQLIVHSHSGYARFLCNGSSNATFSLHKVEQLPQGDGIWIYFEIDNLDEKVSELLALGVISEQLPTDQTWLWREARLKDLDNNQIILYYAGENRIDPPWKLKNLG